MPPRPPCSSICCWSLPSCSPRAQVGAGWAGCPAFCLSERFGHTASQPAGPPPSSAALCLALIPADDCGTPPPAAVAAIVQEKELLLREGMRILGLQVRRAGWTRGVGGWVGWAALGCRLDGALGGWQRAWVLASPPVPPRSVITHTHSCAPLCCLPAACLPRPQDGAYWLSWFLTHFAGMAASGALCALIGLYPFAHSRRGRGWGRVWAG